MVSPSLIIWVILLIGIAFILWVPIILNDSNYGLLSFSKFSEFNDSWVLHLLRNLLGYSTVILPGYFILKYVERHNYLEGKGFTAKLINLCFVGNDDKLPNSSNDSIGKKSTNKERTFMQETWLILFCFVGLQGSYLTWGILQEKVMTKEYTSATGGTGKFSDSQFLVFVNRILAFLLSGVYLCLFKQSSHRAPLYKYSYCSFSNIMSSWCQYEALKFVSFPTQVLAKASKIIPVMLMGKIVSHKSYEFYEYCTAFMISVGMTLFLIGSSEGHHRDTVTTVSGIAILVGYIVFDSFTSNWQSELFSQYHMSSVQMMCSVNLFSCLFTAVSLMQQGGFLNSVSFMSTYPNFIFDILILSVCSAVGQLFIFYTISQFGAVVFTTIMTIRQGLAILISCVLFHHAVTVLGVCGIVMVFVAVFLRMYGTQRLKTLRNLGKAASNVLKV